MTLRIVRLTLVSLALLLLMPACTPPISSQPQSKSSDANLNKASLSPVQVVSEYYKYIEQRDNVAAAQFLTSKLAAAFHSEPDSDFNNVQSISNVKVSKVFDSRLDYRYKYEVQVDANYEAQYRQVITVDSGPQMRFIYLGRNSGILPWEIISIGTGP